MSILKDLILLSALFHVAHSQQSMAMTWTKYKRIHVLESSWEDMEIGDSNLSGHGWDKEIHNTSHFILHLKSCSSKLVQCGAICGATDHCEAYSVESSHCYLANASGLVGVSSGSLSAKTVYINDKIKQGNKSKNCCDNPWIHVPMQCTFPYKENGEWTSWEPWSECIGICNGTVTLGIRVRSKGRTNPVNGGMLRSGTARERGKCFKCGRWIYYESFP